MEIKQKLFVTIGTVAVVATAVVGGAALFSNGSTNQVMGGASTFGATSQSQNTNTANQSTASSSGASASSGATTNASSSATAASSRYKDGTYTKTVSYYVPHGATNSVKVTLTVSGGNITGVTTTNDYADHESGMYINSFESSVSGDATGQSLSSYSPSRIGGASLTTEAFAQAISSIKSDAAA